jgi:FlaA1/EpsC-like NDP-sugar epimerase
MGLLNRHRLWHVAVDGGIAALAWYLAFWVRLDQLPRLSNYLRGWEEYRDGAAPWVVLIKVAVFVAMGLYMRWWRYVSLRDLRAVAQACVAASAAVVVYLAFLPPVPNHFSKTIMVMDFGFTLIGMIAVRAAARTVFERPARGSIRGGKDVLVIGAGSAGLLILREMERTPGIGYRPIGILDDDPRKKGLRLFGAKVLGPTTELQRRLESSPPDEVILAMPSASGAVRQRVVDVCRACTCR